jgi:hypothetical protein
VELVDAQARRQHRVDHLAGAAAVVGVGVVVRASIGPQRQRGDERIGGAGGELEAGGAGVAGRVVVVLVEGVGQDIVDVAVGGREVVVAHGDEPVLHVAAHPVGVGALATDGPHDERDGELHPEVLGDPLAGRLAGHRVADGVADGLVVGREQGDDLRRAYGRVGGQVGGGGLGAADGAGQPPAAKRREDAAVLHDRERLVGEGLQLGALTPLPRGVHVTERHQGLHRRGEAVGPAGQGPEADEDQRRHRLAA